MPGHLKSIYFLLVWTHRATTEWNGTTIDDKHYDDWNDLAVAYYNWGTDESNTTPVFIEDTEAVRNVKYKFMYNGGALRWTDRTTAEKLEDWQKAQTWALGIKGVDIHGRIYPDADCMGTLVHKKIIMTLCACVNSYYASYVDVRLENADASRFRVSSTSDEQFDIRAPNLVASRTSWMGFKDLTGETEKFPISKQIFDSPKCKSAIFATDNHHILQQYKSVVFLKVDVLINHPYRPVLVPYYNFTESRLQESTDTYVEPVRGERVTFYFRKDKVLVAAYYQEAYSQRRGSPNTIELVKVKATGETMDFGSQLMGTEWKENNVNRPGARQRDAFKWLYTCERRMFAVFSEFLNAHEADPSPDAFAWFDEFEMATMKPDVACFELQAGLLCNAPPGSPLVLNDTIIGMTITRVTNCTKITEMEKVNTFVLMLARENKGLDAPSQIEELASYLKNQEELEEKALSKDLVFRDDQEKGDVDVVGNIDSELVAPMAKFLRKNRNRFSPGALSDCPDCKPYSSVPFLTMLIVSKILRYG